MGVECYAGKTQHNTSLFSSCLGDIDVVAVIMIHRGTQIPPFDSMGCPCASHYRLFMDDDLCDRRGKRCGVVVELPMQLCIPRKFGVYARVSEQFEREDGVWDKLVLEMKLEVLVSTGKSRYEVLLESSDCSFR